ncbi:MAG: flagellar biosynthetic protein FliO [Chitinivibrionales bacterium]|nr:flagellar biosynthetic protein FliO [Chitinivibrionales bacterium]
MSMKISAYVLCRSYQPKIVLKACADMKTICAVSVMMLVCCWSAVTARSERDAAFDSDKFIGKVQQELQGYDDRTDTSATSGSGSGIQDRRRENLLFVTLRIVGYLALLIVIIFVLAWLFRKSGIAGGSKLGGGSMDVLEVLPLGQNKSMVLVRMLDGVYLVGQTPTSINLLEKIEGDKAVELIASSKGVVSMTRFKDALGSFMKLGKK